MKESKGENDLGQPYRCTKIDDHQTITSSDHEHYLVAFAVGNQVCCITIPSALLCDDAEWSISLYDFLSEIGAASCLTSRRDFIVYPFIVHENTILWRNGDRGEQ